MDAVEVRSKAAELQGLRGYPTYLQEDDLCMGDTSLNGMAISQHTLEYLTKHIFATID
jgi:hypothetical protein